MAAEMQMIAMQQQHVIDWWRHRGYHVTVLTDWSLQCVSEFALATTEHDRLRDAISRRHAAKWKR